MATDAWVGLGSNQDDPERQLLRALSWLDSLPDTALIEASPLFRTTPVGPLDQPDFLNAVAWLRTGLEVRDLFARMQALENRAGRVRHRHWGERTLDLDLLLFGNAVVADDDLEVPHPRLAERAFVLVPLHSVAPELALPDGSTVESLYRKCNKEGVWYHGEADWRAPS